MPRVGFLIGDGFPTMTAAFRDELRSLGYVEGANLILEMRQSRANTADGRAQLAELVGLDLDLFVAAALPIALEVRRLRPDMRMVVATGPGFIANGLAQSLESPGGNVTGMDELPPGLTGSRLRYLKIAAPGLARVAMLSTTPGRGGHEMQLADAEAEGRNLGIDVKSYRATNLAELQRALAAMAHDNVDGMVNFQGALSLVNRKLIIEFARVRRIPAIYQSKLFVESGGLMSYAPDQDEQFRIAARYVDKILRGSHPGDLPIQHPARYYLTLNTASASTIGLSFPPQLLARADAIVKTI